MSDMAVVEEGSHDEEHEGAARPREIKSVTALSILKSSAKAAAAPDSEKTAEEDAESVETSDESDGEQDVFNMEGLERVRVAETPSSFKECRLLQNLVRFLVYSLTCHESRWTWNNYINKNKSIQRILLLFFAVPLFRFPRS